MSALERLHVLLPSLGLNETEAVVEAHLERAAKEQRAYADFLADLLGEEAEARRARYLLTRTRLAHLPYHKSFAQFDFSFQPSIDKRQIKELQTLRFLSEASNVIFLGPPGVGKTRLAVALALKAIESGSGAYFITAHDLVSDLGRAAREGSRRPWRHPSPRASHGGYRVPATRSCPRP
jgi:DNA replication protein DnaC